MTYILRRCFTNWAQLTSEWQTIVVIADTQAHYYIEDSSYCYHLEVPRHDVIFEDSECSSIGLLSILIILYYLT